MQKLIDANVILRFLLNDNQDMANKASKIIYSGAFTTEAVIAEVVYVLNGVYNMSREKIADHITSILELIDIQNKQTMLYALNQFKKSKLDFVDCLLISYNKTLNISIFSFDKKLNSFL